MKPSIFGLALALWALFLVSTTKELAASETEGARHAAKDPPDPGLGAPFSAWHLSLKTSKGYCGLLPATAAAGGYGFAIACNNKAVQYGAQFTLLLPSQEQQQRRAAAAAADSGPAGYVGGSGQDWSRRQGGGQHEGRELEREREAVRVLLAMDPAGMGSGALGAGGGGGSRIGRATLPLVARSGLGDAKGGGDGGGSGGGWGRVEDPVVLQRYGYEQQSAATAAAAAVAGLRAPVNPVVVTSGHPVRLLSRGSGLCNTPPPAPPPAPPSAASLVEAEAASAERGTGAAGEGGEAGEGSRATGPAARLGRLRSALSSLHASARSAICRLLARGSGLGSSGRGWTWRLPASCTAPASARSSSSSSGTVDGGCGNDGNSGLGTSSPTAHGGGGGGDAGAFGLRGAPPRPLVCAVAQPSALTFRLFRPDLQAGVDLDLSKEWVYLMEGDKFCTLADVDGMSAVVSCHLDSPGWSGYKFQLQPVSYPRTQLVSLMTGGPCGVRLPEMPGPHDVECGTGQQSGRAPELELVLQTPGSAFAAGVVVGLSTFSPGLTGSEQQRCCAAVASPHILLCEPAASTAAVANECWFQLYDVPITKAPPTGGFDSDAGALDVSRLTGGGGGDSGWRRFLAAFLRRLAEELSPDGMDPDPEFDGADPDSGVIAARPRAAALAAAGMLQGQRRAAAEDAGAAEAAAAESGSDAWNGEWDADSRPDPQPDLQPPGATITDPATGGEGIDVSERAAASLRAAAPLGDGSLVMLTSKAFGRYCSASLDGTLLCVSAQASNASRNLFTLVMPPPPGPPLGGSGRQPRGQKEEGRQQRWP